MLIILIVDKNRFLSIKFDTYQSTNIGSQYKSITGLFMTIDFDRFQPRNDGCTKKTMYGEI